MTQLVRAQVVPEGQAPRDTARIQLFSAPDESSSAVASVGRDENLSPMAESLGAGGDKWYLVRTKSGAVGWIKAGETDESKKLESFFKSLPAEPAFSIPNDIPEAASTSAPRNAVEVPVIMTGAFVIVPVKLNRSVQTYMILDTGSSFTVVSRQIAASLGLQSASQTSLLTGNGMISAPLAQLSSITVGNLEAADLTVAVWDIIPNPQLGGLLGLNFLSRYRASIDSRRRLLILAPR